jgi:2-polyprenyl-6-methoxyphenol hydroxylase-like FAD-dependent oxidoreductase
MGGLAGNVAIVGGSLAGLAAGVGLARRGIPVNVFEQNTGEERGGSGLGVELTLISETTGVDASVDGLTHALPVVNEVSATHRHGWPSIDGFGPSPTRRMDYPYTSQRGSI